MVNPKRLKALEAKRDQLNARIQALRAREQAQHRKNDTRRKILIGGMVLKMAKNGEMPETRLRQLLDKYLDADRDRALFGLDPKSKVEPEASTSPGA